MPLKRKLKTRLIHYLHVFQRLISLVIIGSGLILISHFTRSQEEKQWLRDTGATIISIGLAKWLSEQGKRRIKPDGSYVRTPTMRISKKDADRIDTYFKGKT